MTGPQIIVLATPVFLALIALEAWVSHRRGLRTYRLADAAASIGLGMLSQITGLLTKGLTVGLYAAAHQHLALADWPVGHPLTWVAALVFYDFLYYWHHRAGHRVALLWAAHAVHHQSEDYNLSTALRQTATGWVGGWLFYLPMAVAGVPPVVFAVVALIDLLYQFWVHTRLVPDLGWFDRWFCAPSNHRVHHAVNERYVDRNYGGILMCWDRWFGTYQPEDPAEPCVYGTRSPLRSWDPLWANLQVYAALWKDARHARGLTQWLKVWLAPPGWRPPAAQDADPKPAFDLAAVRLWDPALGAAARVAVPGLFTAALTATALLLWNAHRLAALPLLAGCTAVAALLWAVGRVSR